MQNPKFKITFGDGSVLENLALNGNNFITEQRIDVNFFAESRKFINVKIEAQDENFDPESAPMADLSLLGEHAFMKLIQITMPVYDKGKTWFILADISEQELKELEVDARISFLEMLETVTEEG
ncbi:MAG: hypothetical protein IJS40_05095 [Synergistaceae bacterium]|nr:hypothetical protein [Synergistaceae bacterium]